MKLKLPNADILQYQFSSVSSGENNLDCIAKMHQKVRDLQTEYLKQDKIFYILSWNSKHSPSAIGQDELRKTDILDYCIEIVSDWDTNQDCAKKMKEYMLELQSDYDEKNFWIVYWDIKHKAALKVTLEKAPTLTKPSEESEE